MKKTYTSVEALLADESFVKYCMEELGNHAFWQNYLKAHPEQEGLLDEAKKTLLLLQESLADEDTEEQLGRLKQLIESGKAGAVNLSGPAPKTVRNTFPVRKLILRYVAAAAVILLAVFGSYQLLWLPSHHTNLPASRMQIKYDIYTCEVGSRKTMLLPDSTIIILNSNSSLSIPENFSSQNRTVLLKGAAFFDVSHHEESPFTVKTENLTTTDIGTSFLVRAYQNEKDARVMLLDGKVRVETGDRDKASVSHNMIELNKGERIIVNNENGQLLTDAFDTTALKKWKAGRLAFKNASFENVVRELQLWYGVQITVRGAQRTALHFTGNFDHEKLDNILQVICFSMNCRYEIKGDKITFTF